MNAYILIYKIVQSFEKWCTEEKEYYLWKKTVSVLLSRPQTPGFFMASHLQANPKEYMHVKHETCDCLR